MGPKFPAPDRCRRWKWICREWILVRRMHDLSNRSRQSVFSPYVYAQYIFCVFSAVPPRAGSRARTDPTVISPRFGSFNTIYGFYGFQFQRDGKLKAGRTTSAEFISRFARNEKRTARAFIQVKKKLRSLIVSNRPDRLTVFSQGPTIMPMSRRNLGLDLLWTAPFCAVCSWF